MLIVAALTTPQRSKPAHPALSRHLLKKRARRSRRAKALDWRKVNANRKLLRFMPNSQARQHQHIVSPFVRQEEIAKVAVLGRVTTKVRARRWLSDSGRP
jgi:hypothetical protein